MNGHMITVCICLYLNSELKRKQKSKLRVMNSNSIPSSDLITLGFEEFRNSLAKVKICYQALYLDNI